MPADRDDSYSAGQKYFPFAAPLLPSGSEDGGCDDGHGDENGDDVIVYSKFVGAAERS